MEPARVGPAWLANNTAGVQKGWLGAVYDVPTSIPFRVTCFCRTRVVTTHQNFWGHCIVLLHHPKRLLRTPTEVSLRACAQKPPFFGEGAGDALEGHEAERWLQKWYMARRAVGRQGPAFAGRPAGR